MANRNLSPGPVACDTTEDLRVSLAQAIDLLQNARASYVDPSLRQSWARERKRLVDAAIRDGIWPR